MYIKTKKKRIKTAYVQPVNATEVLTERVNTNKWSCADIRPCTPSEVYSNNINTSSVNWDRADTGRACKNMQTQPVYTNKSLTTKLQTPYI